MSEKLQHTTAFNRKKMQNRYPDESEHLHEKIAHKKQLESNHKHNKLHQLYREHWRTHPIAVDAFAEENIATNQPTGFVRKGNLHKLFTRLKEKRYH